MEKHINKIDGSESKLDLTTFLRIRNIPIARYLSENNVNSLISLEAFILQLEYSSHFDVSDVFRNEAKQLFSKNNDEVVIQNDERFDPSTNSEKEIENQNTISDTVIKTKKKKSTNNNDLVAKD